MLKFIVYLTFCRFLLTKGSPIIQEEERPCLNHQQNAQEQMRLNGNITEDVGYIPRCNTDGMLWEEKQCTLLNGGSCFCVDTETGVPRENTRIYTFSIDYLHCEAASTCQEALERYVTFTENNANVADAPYGYRPSCEENGRFTAMQRNAFYFFCVDTITGDQILDTESVPPESSENSNQNNDPRIVHRIKPLTEDICQSYSNLWQSYKEWLVEYGYAEMDDMEAEIITNSSCTNGMEFIVNGCKRRCIAGRKVTDGTNCAFYKPVCTCPAETYEYNNTCVTREQCMEFAAEPFAFQAEETLWNSFLVVNSNELLRNYWGVAEGFVYVSISEESENEDLTQIENPTTEQGMGNENLISLESITGEVEEEEEEEEEEEAISDDLFENLLNLDFEHQTNTNNQNENEYENYSSENNFSSDGEEGSTDPLVPSQGQRPVSIRPHFLNSYDLYLLQKIWNVRLQYNAEANVERTNQTDATILSSGK